jgi:hypothetical protein
MGANIGHALREPPVKVLAFAEHPISAPERHPLAPLPLARFAFSSRLAMFAWI